MCLIAIDKCMVRIYHILVKILYKKIKHHDHEFLEHQPDLLGFMVQYVYNA